MNRAVKRVRARGAEQSRVRAGKIGNISGAVSGCRGRPAGSATGAIARLRYRRNDLARRLRATRSADDYANDDRSFGVPAGYAPAEEPDLYVADVRDFFRPPR